LACAITLTKGMRMDEIEWITTEEASQIYGKSQRYIQMICKGRRRRKGKAIWHVLPKVKNIKYIMSAKNKPMVLIFKAELDELFTKQLEQTG
jgi:hypothetical protein